MLVIIFEAVPEKVNGVIYMGNRLLRVLLLILSGLMAAHPNIPPVDTTRLNRRLRPLRELEIDGLSMLIRIPHDVWVHSFQAIISSF